MEHTAPSLTAQDLASIIGLLPEEVPPPRLPSALATTIDIANAQGADGSVQQIQAREAAAAESRFRRFRV